MTRLRTLVAVLVTLAVGAAAISCSDSGDATESTASPVASVTASAPTIEVSDAPPGPATFKVIAGRSEGNIDVEAFMPANIRVRVGDTIEWTALGYEGHTVTFGDGDDTLAGIGDYLVPNPDNPDELLFNPVLSLPSEKQGTHDGDTTFINSGFFGVPVEQQYRLTFTKEGLFTYLCLVHPFTMTGTVTVEDAAATVESPDTVAARGRADLARFTDGLKAEAERVAADERSAPGPNGATIHYVQVGAITDHGQVAVYTPGVLDIEAGDTVIFENDDRNFHNVIFKGARAELPAGIGILPGPDGLNFSLHPDSAIAVDPPLEGFDETTFLSSGSMGVLQPRLTWTLRFDTPGMYVYACTIHTLAGMTGVINVR